MYDEVWSHFKACTAVCPFLRNRVYCVRLWLLGFRSGLTRLRLLFYVSFSFFSCFGYVSSSVFSLYLCVRVHLSVLSSFLSLSLSVCFCLYLFACLPACLSLCLSVCLRLVVSCFVFKLNLNYNPCKIKFSSSSPPPSLSISVPLSLSHCLSFYLPLSSLTFLLSLYLSPLILRWTKICFLSSVN